MTTENTKHVTNPEVNQQPDPAVTGLRTGQAIVENRVRAGIDAADDELRDLAEFELGEEEG